MVVGYTNAKNRWFMFLDSRGVRINFFFDLVDDDTVSCVERARRNGDEIV